MKKILFATLLSLNLFTFNALAQDDKDDEVITPTPVFQNSQDRTQQINQQYSNNLIYSPFNSPFAQSRFVPDIALITDFSYAYRNFSNQNFGSSNLSGFGAIPTISNNRNGFNFNYGELVISSSVDPFFDLFSTFHLSEFGFEVEEAYINTRALPWGLQVKGGKFLSSFGRLNSQHGHFWDFSDQPMIYGALLSEHALLEKGVQVNWVAPTDTFLMFGVESFVGENEKSFGTGGFTKGQYKLEEVNHPNLFTSFIKTSIDFDDLIFLGGVSYARGGSRVITGEEEKPSGLHVHALDDKANFAGETGILAIDLTAKYFLDSYRYFSWQTEFLQRNMVGSNYTDNDRIVTNKEQGGLYSQLIYKFNQQWRCGLRYDLITQNQIKENDKPLATLGNLAKYSAMVDFNPTEFSRIRLQYNYDLTRTVETNQQPLHEVFLQLNMAIGAHGAHSF